MSTQADQSVSRWRGLRPLLLMALPLAAAWGAAFWVTGMLWWRAPAGHAESVPPPPPAKVHPVDTSWVDLDLYRRSNPQWRP